MLARAAAVDPEFSGSFRTIVGRDPIAISREEPVAAAVLASCEAVLGRAPTVRGDIGWMDSGILFESGVPCLTCGPTGAGEHTGVEWVDVASVETCARVLEATARAFRSRGVGRCEALVSSLPVKGRGSSLPVKVAGARGL